MSDHDHIADLHATYFALCAHVRDVHGIHAVGTAGQIEAAHQRAHTREGTRWHLDAWQLPDPDRKVGR